MSVEGLYLKVKSMWNNQLTVQEARLDQLEKQDPRLEEFAASDSDSGGEDFGTAGLALYAFGIRPVDADADAEADTEV